MLLLCSYAGLEENEGGKKKKEKKKKRGKQLSSKIFLTHGENINNAKPGIPDRLLFQVDR